VLTKSPRWNPGIQKSRLEYYILFRSNSNRINVGKGIKILEEIAQRAISSRYGNFVFRCLSSFGIIDYLYERLSLDMNMGYRILLNSSHRILL
jgi:hypothetical protein